GPRSAHDRGRGPGRRARARDRVRPRAGAGVALRRGRVSGDRRGSRRRHEGGLARDPRRSQLDRVREPSLKRRHRDPALAVGASADGAAARVHGPARGRRSVGGDARRPRGLRTHQPSRYVPRRRVHPAAPAAVGVLAAPVPRVRERAEPPTSPAGGRRRRDGAVACDRRGIRATPEGDAWRAPAAGRGGPQRDPRRGRRRALGPARGARPGGIRADRGGPAGVSVTRRAHAKLNVFLRVLGVREGRYHDIETGILPLELHDVVTAETADGFGVTVTGPRAGELAHAGGEALVERAARAWAHETGREAPGATITVDKRIPVAAGLGGGSADAAAAILALDELQGTDLATETLVGIAAAVGSDVPALLLGGPVY